MKIKIFLTLLVFSGVLFSQNNLEKILIDDLVGHWSFSDPSDLTKASVGDTLELVGTDASDVGPFGATKIGVGSHYKATHGISPNGGGSKVNKYTIVMDIKIPQSNIWYAFYQTDPANMDDADWFLNGDGNMGVGAVGYTTQVFNKEEWYRIAISVSNGNRYDYYIDGEKVKAGTPGSIDGRFALDTKVLFFADQNGEDNSLSVADVKIYSRDLSDYEIGTLGGYPHENQGKIYPYLQSPTSNSIYVSWSSKGSTSYVVEYGLTETLGDSAEATKEYFYDQSVTWYTAKLENLTPSTIYYYKVRTDSAVSEIFRFKTQPVDNDSTEHFRFAVIGDSRTYPAKFKEVNDSLMSKIISLYGNDLEKNLNLIFNVGDIVTDGRELLQYQDEYFEPIGNLSAYIPHMVSIGNHERESSNYYKHMKYEDFGGAQGERYYSFRMGKVLFISLNTNTDYRNTTQIQWLTSLLNEAQADDSIEWIFAFAHHPGRCEMWPDGNTAYAEDQIIPLLAKYSKVDMYTFGHTHDYERGTAKNSDNLRLLLSGGGGSSLEAWGYYPNQENLKEIQKSFDHYCYSIIDVDIANKFCEVTTYSLGNRKRELDNVVIDHFIRDKADQTPPDNFSLIAPQNNAHLDPPFNIQGSNYKGIYDIMSSQFQVTTEAGNYVNPTLNIERDFEDYYGVTTSNVPIDLNLGIDLTKYVVTEDMLISNTQYWVRARYRDKNLQWSEWTDETSFFVNDPSDVSKDDIVIISDYKLYANYPNPFNPTTIIQFDLPETSIVNLSVYNNLGELVVELENGRFNAGHYESEFDATSVNRRISSGIYYCRLKANNFTQVQKMTLLK